MSRAKDVDELLRAETPELRAQIKARGQQLLRAETLRQLRALASKTQAEVEGMKQDGVSRLERRNDLLLSSLNAYVRGLGGTLKIVAEIPEVGAVDLELTGDTRIKPATVRKTGGRS